MRLPLPGRTYHYVYGYRWRWGVLAELAWRVEHAPVGWLARCGYRWRKRFERRAP